jgi:hypothetical protein
MGVQEFAGAEDGPVGKLDTPAVGVVVPAGVRVAQRDVEPLPARAGIRHHIDHRRGVGEGWHGE